MVGRGKANVRDGVLGRDEWGAGRVECISMNLYIHISIYLYIYLYIAGQEHVRGMLLRSA